MRLKVGDGVSTVWSAFGVEITPGFDVGAHLHRQAEEFFYVLRGELDLLALSRQALLQFGEPAGCVVHLLDSQAKPVPEAPKPFAACPGDRLFQLPLLGVFVQSGGGGHDRLLAYLGPWPPQRPRRSPHRVLPYVRPAPVASRYGFIETVGSRRSGGIRCFHMKVGRLPYECAAVRAGAGRVPCGPWPRRAQPARTPPACGRRGRGWPPPYGG